MWQDMDAILAVAEHKTLRAAAQVLGLHRATLARRIESFEATLGARVFHRHERGYHLTELGRKVVALGQSTAAELALIKRSTHEDAGSLQGELLISCHPMLAARLMPAIKAFLHLNSQMRVAFEATQTISKLEEGQAHIAFRIGPKPQQPDLVVQVFETIEFSLFGAPSYFEDRARKRTSNKLDNHLFVLPSGEAGRAPFIKSLKQRVKPEQIVFTSDDVAAVDAALRAGIGIGFAECENGGNSANLHEVAELSARWPVQVWVCTHVDVHKLAKIQALLSFVRQAH